MGMREKYDQFAEAFRKADNLTTWKYVVKPALEKILDLRAGMKVLDLGSASARVEVGVLLPKGILPQDITGVELSPAQVEMAQVRVPEARFLAGDIADPDLLQGEQFDVVFSSMVFEHLSDEQLKQVCANAHRLLKPDGQFAFVVTHPDKMKDKDGNYVTTYGPFETTVPWGGVVKNWRRGIDQMLNLMPQFEITLVEELGYPRQAPKGLSTAEWVEFEADAAKYLKDKYIRLAIQAKPL